MYVDKFCKENFIYANKIEKSKKLLKSIKQKSTVSMKRVALLLVAHPRWLDVKPI